jgi:glycerol-3-phosphate dehydrogenase
MAEETIDAAIKEFNLGRYVNGPSQTDHIKLIGAHAWTKTMYIKLIQQFGLEMEVAKHLAESYGDRAWTVASMAKPTGTFDHPQALFYQATKRTKLNP